MDPMRSFTPIMEEDDLKNGLSRTTNGQSISTEPQRYMFTKLVLTAYNVIIKQNVMSMRCICDVHILHARIKL